FRSANQRMHNKTFIVDHKIVITGGRNIADEYFDYDHEYNFRDRDVLLLGKTTKDVATSFTSFWADDLCVPVAELIKDTPENTIDPHRFDKEAEIKQHSFAYLPFGGGSRICVGNHFAMMEAVFIAAMVTQRFKVVLPSNDIEPQISLTTRPKGGVPFTLESR
ncbi:MAG: cytochrome P450, partial [Spirosomaceae bacterium]|nr:cytochrome P450 [Spirosomataceae bacterium]